MHGISFYQITLGLHMLDEEKDLKHGQNAGFTD